MAEGALHDFEGWMVYMVCLGILLIEIKLLSKRDLSEVLLFHNNDGNIKNVTYQTTEKNNSWPTIVASAIVVISVLLVSTISHDDEVIPPRKSFDLFPTVLSDKWKGSREYFKNNEQSVLRVTDYLLMDYMVDGKPTNLYVGYHESQRSGTSPHSPRACIPGSGWEIASIDRVPIPEKDGSFFYANKLIIQKGETKQLVYYWFQQRGRKIDNEFVLKWYLFKDAISLNRTDGALVRLTTPVESNEKMTDAEKRLQAFAQVINPILPNYIPE
jgi:EpsI family protein